MVCINGDTTGISDIGFFNDLEDAGNKLSSASILLDNAIQILIENYPELYVLLNRLPIKKRQHPYLRIILAAYLYRHLRRRQINLTN